MLCLMRRNLSSSSSCLLRRNPCGGTARAFSSFSQKDAFLQDAIQFVPQYGWTQEALAAAAASNQYSIAWTCKVTVVDWIFHVMDEWNAALSKKMAQLDGDDLPLTARLEEAIRFRLEWILQYEQQSGGDVMMKHWPAAMAVGAHPNHVMTTQQKLHDCVDILLPPHTATELERASLGALLVAAELHLVADGSPDHVETWQFVHKSLEQWESFRNPGTAFSSNNSLSASEMAYAATTVGASVLTGAASVLFHSSPVVASSVSSAVSFAQTMSQPLQPSAGVPGTHPSDYDAK